MGEKPFECPHCDLAIWDNSPMKINVTSIHVKIKFTFDFCENNFVCQTEKYYANNMYVNGLLFPHSNFLNTTVLRQSALTKIVCINLIRLPRYV